MNKIKCFIIIAAIFSSVLFLNDSFAQNSSTRYDFTIVSISWKSNSFMYRNATPAGNLTWELNRYLMASQGAHLEVTWELKSNVQGTAFGNALLNNATNPQLTSIRLREVKGSGFGAVKKEITLNSAERQGSNRLIARIPLNELTNEGDKLGLFFNVRYPTRNDPNLRSYHDGIWQQIKLENRVLRVTPGIINPNIGRGGNNNGAVLTWSSPITAANFPDLTNSAVTTTAQRQRIENHTLSEIVSSVIIARDDNARCSACHFQTTGVSQFYRPPVNQNAQTTISPTTAYYAGANGATRSWAAANGFAERFLERHAAGQLSQPSIGRKPLFLRKLFEKWKNDGYQQ